MSGSSKHCIALRCYVTLHSCVIFLRVTIYSEVNIASNVFKRVALCIPVVANINKRYLETDDISLINVT